MSLLSNNSIFTQYLPAIPAHPISVPCFIFQPTNINSIETEGLKLTDFLHVIDVLKWNFAKCAAGEYWRRGVANMGLTEAIG